MREPDRLRVQHEPFSAASVESVTDNRRAEPQRMGRVNAQLVRAAGQWKQLHARAAVATFHDTPFRHRGFAVNGIVDLPRAIVEIDSERKIDRPLVATELAVDPRRVA